eukprot:995002-Prorocentrum_minimum.AAC.1
MGKKVGCTNPRVREDNSLAHLLHEETEATVVLKRTREVEQEAYIGGGPRGEQWEKVGYWTQGEKRGWVSGVVCASLPFVTQEDP